MVLLRDAIYAKFALPALLVFPAIELTLHRSAPRRHPPADETGSPSSWRPPCA
jgi:hypothetical protein